MQLHITPLTRQMIKAKGLDVVLDGVLREIRDVKCSTPQTRKVEIEWERDPEVEGWEMLSVTLWCNGSPQEARKMWQDMDERMKTFRQRLSESDLEKLDRFVSVGVDIG